MENRESNFHEDYIRRKLSPSELVYILADEATELAQSALKVYSAMEDEDLMMSYGDALEELVEQYAITTLCGKMLFSPEEFGQMKAIRKREAARWVQWLQEKGDGECEQT